MTPTPLFDGVISMLDWLRSHDIALAVATGKARAGLDRVMNEAKLVDYFDHTICADEAQGKPNPDMVKRLLTTSGHQQQQTILVGDSIHDMHMARNAGIDSIGVTSGAHDQQSLAAFSPIVVLDNVTHMQDWLNAPHPS